MAGVFIISENSSMALQLLSAGLEMGSNMQKDVIAVAFSQEDAEILVSSGARKVFALQCNNTLPENHARTIADLLKSEEADLALVGATVRGRELAARVAAYLRVGLVSEALSIRFVENAIETQRLMYGGAVVCTEKLTGMSVITIGHGQYQSAKIQDNRSGEIVAVKTNPDPGIIVLKIEAINHRSSDITKANRVVGVGRGVAQKEDMKLPEELANAISAELGCTRSIAEELHWLPNESYIGISGQSIKPDLYIALGISGQIQHVVGIRGSKIIVAIDSNAKAPIFNAADYGIVGNIYDVVPALTELLKNDR